MSENWLDTCQQNVPRRRSRCRTKRSSFGVLMSFLWLLLLLLCWKTAGNVATAAEAVVDEEMNLQAMTDEELEAICVERGFELVKDMDEATGETYVYTHDDYVNAAKECLAIESEMQRILEENPEMVDRMKEEAERLTKERESLEQQLLDAQEKLQGGGGASGADAGDNSIPKEGVAFVNDGTRAQPQRAAFVGSVEEEAEHEQVGDSASAAKEEETTEKEEPAVNEPTAEEAWTDETTASSNSESAGTASLDDDDDESMSNADDTDEDTTEGTDAETNDVNDGNTDTPTEDEDAILKEVLDDSSSSTEETAISSSTGSNSSSPLQELLDLLQEARERVKRDMEKVGAVLLPHPIRKPLRAALKPVVRVTKRTAVTLLDMMKRYILALLQKTSGETAKKEVEGAEEQTEGDPAQQEQRPGQA